MCDATRKTTSLSAILLVSDRPLCPIAAQPPVPCPTEISARPVPCHEPGNGPVSENGESAKAVRPYVQLVVGEKRKASDASVLTAEECVEASVHRTRKGSQRSAPGRWTGEEHSRFVEGTSD